MGGRHKDPEYHKKWWAANRDKYNYSRPHSDPDYQKVYYEVNKEKVLTRHKKHREDNPELRLYKSAKGSAKKRGIPFDLRVEDVIIPELCPVLGVPMCRFTEYTPSIDRINNSLGYVKENIQVISKKANVMKSSATPEELLAFANWIKTNYTPIHIEEILK